MQQQHFTAGTLDGLYRLEEFQGHRPHSVLVVRIVGLNLYYNHIKEPHLHIDNYHDGRVRVSEGEHTESKEGEDLQPSMGQFRETFKRVTRLVGSSKWMISCEDDSGHVLAKLALIDEV